MEHEHEFPADARTAQEAAAAGSFPPAKGGRWLLNRDDIAHMGYTLGRLPDGQVPTYPVRVSRGTLLHEREFIDHRDQAGGAWDGPDAEQVPQPAALVPVCVCGWHGAPRPYSPEGGQFQDAHGVTRHDGQDLDALGDWTHHARAAAAAVDPTTPASHRERLAELADTLGELTDERPRAALNLARMLHELADHVEPLAVAQALALGVTWDSIGDDLGVTRQAVQSRYRKPSQGMQQRVHDLTGGTVPELLAAVTQRRPGTPPPGHHQWPETVRRILATAPADTAQDSERTQPMVNNPTAARVIAAARQSWSDDPETEGGADAFDFYISTHGVEPRGPLFNETYTLANADHPIYPGAGEAALTACKERALQLWQQLLPALEEYADQCRAARYSGWSTQSGGPVRRVR